MTIATSKIPPNNIPGKPWFKIFDPSVEVSDLSVPCEAFKVIYLFISQLIINLIIILLLFYNIYIGISKSFKKQ